MEIYFEAFECRSLPSSLVFYSTKHKTNITMFGNGSHYLYLLETVNKSHLATVKFSTAVDHVSLLHSCGSEDRRQGDDACGVCCLGDGRIVAINLEKSLQVDKAPQRDQSPMQADDIFASLLSTASTSASSHTHSKKNETMIGENISTPIGACGDPQAWMLLCAMVYNDKLIICKRSKKDGRTLLSVQTSTSKASSSSTTVPTFHGAPSSECTLSSSKVTDQTSSMIRYRPRFVIILKEGSVSFNSLSGRNNVFVINSKLFLHLFGLDVHLSESPVLVVGGQNGHISYCALNMVGEKDGLVLTPLYSLEQPVVMVCAPFFPRNRALVTLGDMLVEEQEDAQRPEVSGVSNSLLFFGLRGKVAICFVGGKDQVEFIQFQTPAPVLSSVLVPNRCLIYSTLCGMHRICLRQGCVETLEDASLSSSNEDTRPILIPEMSFKFPERISPTVANAILLDAEESFSTSEEEPMDVGTSSEQDSSSEIQTTVMFFDGRVGSLAVNDGNVRLGFKDAQSASQELEKHLKSIEMTSEKIGIVNSKIASLDAKLAELNIVLTLFCDVLKSRDDKGLTSSPFCCKFNATFEDVSVTKWKPVIDVEMNYNRPGSSKSLGTGWSLLIQSSNEQTSASCGAVVTKTIPLGGLLPDNSVKGRINVEVEPGRPLLCTLHCILHYNASDLFADSDEELSMTETSKSVSILLCSRTFDALDFVQPHGQASKELYLPLAELFPSSLQGSEKKQSYHNLEYSLELPVFRKSSEERTSGEDLNESDTCGQILRSLLPCTVIERSGKRSRESVTVTTYDGSSILLGVVPKLRLLDESSSSSTNNDIVKVIIKSSSRNMLTEVTSCVERRLKSNPSVMEGKEAVDSLSNEQKCRRLVELNRIEGEANILLGEIAALDKEKYHDISTRHQELEMKAYRLFCQLKQLP